MLMETIKFLHGNIPGAPPPGGVSQPGARRCRSRFGNTEQPVAIAVSPSINRAELGNLGVGSLARTMARVAMSGSVGMLPTSRRTFISRRRRHSAISSPFGRAFGREQTAQQRRSFVTRHPHDCLQLPRVCPIRWMCGVASLTAASVRKRRSLLTRTHVQPEENNSFPVPESSSRERNIHGSLSKLDLPASGAGTTAKLLPTRGGRIWPCGFELRRCGSGGVARGLVGVY